MSKLTFLREFLRAPGRVGSVWPSSQSLARRMVETAALKPGEVVVELGAGVGPITKHLYALRDNVRLIALEPNVKLTEILKDTLPGLDVIDAPAQKLHAILAERSLERVDCVVSCLPWSIWPAPLRDEVLDVVHSVLKPGARLVTFSYCHLQPFPPGWRLRRALRQRFESVEWASWALKNMPPAVVFRCVRGKDLTEPVTATSNEFHPT